jgi:alkylhydroperoxidase/carboxymuconolactone decarboxylase family protein YurZ
MDAHLYPSPSRELALRRNELAPGISAAFKAFGAAVFADGALSAKTRQLIAVAAAHVTMRAGAAYAHANLALETMNELGAGRTASR